MPQTLPNTFSLPAQPSSHRSNLPMRSFSGLYSIDALLEAMDRYLLKAKTQMLQPRKKAIDFILNEASRLN